MPGGPHCPSGWGGKLHDSALGQLDFLRADGLRLGDTRLGEQVRDAGEWDCGVLPQDGNGQGV